MKKNILIGSLCIALTSVGLCGCDTEAPSIEQVQQKEDPELIKKHAMERVLEDRQIVKYATVDSKALDKSLLLVGRTYEVNSVYMPNQAISFYEYNPDTQEYTIIEDLSSGEGMGMAGASHGSLILDDEGNLYKYSLSGGTGLYQYDKLESTDGQYRFVPYLSGSKAEEQQKNLPPADEDILKSIKGLIWKANTTDPNKVSEEVKQNEEQAGNQIATVTLRYVNPSEIQQLLDGKDVPLNNQYNPTQQYYLIAIFPKDYKMPGQSDDQTSNMYVLNDVVEAHDYFKKYLPLDYLNGNQVALAFNSINIGDPMNIPGVPTPIKSLADAKIL